MATSTETDGSENSFVVAPPRLVPTIHKTPYPSLLPHRPELNQFGRTILITGGSAGIGLAIARAYAEASASNIILTGRRSDVLHQASSKLSETFPKVNIIPRVCDVANAEEVARLWSSLSDEGIFVDVLVLNAAKFGQQQQPLLETDLEETWSLYETNVKAILDFCQRLHKQPGADDKKKYIVYVSTAAIHLPSIASALPDYSLSKMSGHLLVQKIAEEVDREKLQIVTFHPGQILSEKARSAGLDENSFPFDDENLPGRWALWASTSQATFLHGRFAWAAWDVDELRSGDVKRRMDTDPEFLTLQFVGL
ncbi:Hypothetical protein NCS54_00736500 [Fusarium falciforme]|uniref:Hypothetical protein n=1 Tax=Fusarium falciforme TaxID=195108 RepID=UPI00230186F6|nr:Hypothetical protein NCS54_00736500 [Fusarium falciforme]WAO89961.1 Hypothetical protein NCS54_00736500 [Fusarium falciforme]